MKLHIFLIILFFPVLCFAQTKVNYDDLQEIDGKFYMAGSKTPFTGQCYTTYPSGKLGMGGSFKNGLRDGEWIWFYETGTKKRYAN
jgi:antitoxin component YwqK of YwqJK toxin-antitoxin module